jgi:4-hydroxyphenylpyruvate dioxygenase-like putative hemolysin
MFFSLLRLADALLFSTFVQPPAGVKYSGFDHLKFWVGNAKQAAAWYVGRFGFHEIAYKGLETGSRDFAHHVIQQNKVRSLFNRSNSNQIPVRAIFFW